MPAMKVRIGGGLIFGIPLEMMGFSKPSGYQAGQGAGGRPGISCQRFPFVKILTIRILVAKYRGLW